MFKFVLQFIIIFALWWSNKKAKGSWIVPSGILLGLYTLCSLMGVFTLYNGYYTQPFEDSYWMPMLFFDLFILLFLLPFRQFKEVNIQTISLPSLSFLNVFSDIVIVLSLFSIIFFGSSVRSVLSMADLGAARNDMVSGALYFEKGILATIGSVASANYVFAIVLFFIFKILGGNRIRCGLLLVSSFSEVIQVLAFVGRDGIVFWLFSFAYLYAFFRPFMDKKTGKELIRKALVWIGVILIPFIMITISRFGNSGVGDSIITYLGQAFVNGPLFFGIEDKPILKGVGFPLFYELTGRPTPVSIGGVIYGDWVSWQFSTFVVSLYRSLGLLGLIIVAFFMYFLFYIVTYRIKSEINLGQLSFYILYFQIIGEGVFYFKHATRGGNLFIVTTLLLSLFFSIAVKFSPKRTILYRVR